MTVTGGVNSRWWHTDWKVEAFLGLRQPASESETLQQPSQPSYASAAPIVVTPTTKLLSLLLHNCSFVTVVGQSVNICAFQWS